MQVKTVEIAQNYLEQLLFKLHVYSLTGPTNVRIAGELSQVPN